jgi:hypothetical protein
MQARAGVLFLPREMADELSLRYHISLALLGAGHGSHYHLMYVTEILLLTFVLTEAGYGNLPASEFITALAGASAALHRGNREDKWYLDRGAINQFGEILELHDWQLVSASAPEIAAAHNKATAMLVR